MTAADLVDKLMSDEHADVLRDSRGLDGHPADGGRGRRARSAPSLVSAPPTAATQRNGYRQRAGTPGSGSSSWPSPGCGPGSYFPSFLEPRRRAEQALVAVVQEAYVNGVSTRKVDRLVEQLGLHQHEQGQVVAGCVAAWTSRSRVFRERPVGRRLPVPVAGRQGGAGPRAGWGPPQGPGDRLRRAPDAAAARWSAWTSARPRPRRSGAAFLRSLRARGLDGVQLVHLRRPHRPQDRDRQGARLPLAALHRPLPARHARPRRPGPAAAGVGRDPRDLRRRLRRRGARTAWPGRRPARARMLPRSPGCWRTPRPTCWPSTGSQPSTGPSSEHQPVGAGQQGDQAQNRCRV